ncbi:pilus assembly protein TadG-related protein [Methylobacterium sp. E-041]|uniref:pilus assembly protein TadG-related protein n=1 Tax=Methylobacterium sp. E-041 TaxID=2836573 RepID=UPI001FBB2A5E|nr:pilus assembly protein TadG-related protein [Methylobacterium sp. E-041]MCJ2108347.1 pilus assembly protein TadG-related protein [Methylobacterium sp. E-041]
MRSLFNPPQVKVVPLEEAIDEPRFEVPSTLSRRDGFLVDCRGGVAIIFGLSATLLLGLVGGGVDYARLSYRRTQLQSAVDAGTLAGGNTLKLASSTVESVQGVTEQTVRDSAHLLPDRPFTLTVTVAKDKTSVFARAEETVRLAFGAFLGIRTTVVAVQARANVVGKMRLCMLTLDQSAPGAFNLQTRAEVTADGCSLYSNSSNVKGMFGGDSAMAKAQTICSAGGYSGARANFAPPPQTGCPTLGDPLKDRSLPVPGSCMPIPASANSKGDTSKNLVDQSVTLDPGTYCGGLHITKKANVTLRSGIYVMKDGPLVVDQKGSLTGTDVGLFFAGDQAGLLFDKKSTISLAAPTTGIMAGLLMAEDRTVSSPVDPTTAIISFVGALLSPLSPAPSPTPQPLGLTRPLRTYRIISDDARTMLGTIYLPVGRLVIDADKPVADQSAYTVIVAAQVNLYEGPNLYLNANYDATSVPVPKGVGPISGKLLLTQ